MREIEWYETYELGFEDIDADHRRVFEIANSMMRALDGMQYDECRQLASNFLDALKEHFEREENFLREIGYPKTEEHSRYHKGLLVNAEKFKGLCDGAEEGQAVVEHFSDLISVLLADIRGGDLHFRSYLLEKGLNQAMEERGLSRLWL